MKKFAFSVLIAAVSFLFIQQAQAQKYAQGDIDLNLGVGVSSGFSIIPVYFGGNYMIKDWLSAGAEVGFRMDRVGGLYLYSYNRNGFSFVTRADYHFNELFNLPEKFDVYGGVDLGMAFFGKLKHDGYEYPYSYSNAYFLGGPHAGARLFFGSKFAINAQLGARSGDGAIFQFGATMKL
jgi:hypothetical protein